MKVLFFDIDGTLLDHSGRMPYSTSEALKRAKENGHQLIVCSGRSKCAVKQLVEKFSFDGCICSAGAYVEYRGQIVSRDLLDAKQQGRLIEFFEQTGAVYGLQCRDFMVCPSGFKKVYEDTFGPQEREDSCLQECGEKKSEETQSEETQSEETQENEKLDDIGKTVIFTDDIRSVQDVEKAFYFGSNIGVIESGRILGEEFDVRPASYNMPDANNGEVSLSGVTKSYGMQKILDYLQVDKADTVAFGDGYNDLEMLEFAQYGVAMGNGVDVLKEVADHVTDTVDQDGIAKALKALGLI